MRVEDGYELIEILEEWIVVPIGDSMLSLEGMAALSESGAFLWKQLKEDKNTEELVALLLSEYMIDESTAQSDVQEFIDELDKNGLLLA